MGNTVLGQQTYKKNQWSKHQQLFKTPGSPMLLISIDNQSLHAEQYKYYVNKSQNQIEEAIIKRKLLLHKNIVKILDYQINYKLSNQPQISIITERISFRLENISKRIKFTFQEMLFILKQTLTGMNILYLHKISCYVNSNMIGINNKGQIKVWINQNFGKNTPFLQNNIKEDINVDNILRVILQNVDLYPSEVNLKKHFIERIHQQKNINKKIKFNQIFSILKYYISYQHNENFFQKNISFKVNQLNGYSLDLKKPQIYITNQVNKKRAVSEQIMKNRNKVLNQTTNDSQFYKLSQIQKQAKKTYSDVCGNIHLNKQTIYRAVFPNKNQIVIKNSPNYTARCNYQSKRVRFQEANKRDGYFQIIKNKQNKSSLQNKGSELTIIDSLEKKPQLKVNFFDSMKGSYNTAFQNKSKLLSSKKPTLNFTYKNKNQSQFEEQKPQKNRKNNKNFNIDRLQTIIQTQVKNNISSNNVKSNCTKNPQIRVNTSLFNQNAYSGKKMITQASVDTNSSEYTPSNNKNKTSDQIYFPSTQSNNQQKKKKPINFFKKKQFFDSIFKIYQSSTKKKSHFMTIISQSSMNFNIQSRKSIKQNKNIQTEQFVLQKQEESMQEISSSNNKCIFQQKQQKVYVSKAEQAEEMVQLETQTQQNDKENEDKQIMSQSGKYYLDVFKYYLGSQKGQSKRNAQQSNKTTYNQIFSHQQDFQKQKQFSSGANQNQQEQSMEIQNGKNENYQIGSYSGLQTIEQTSQYDQSCVHIYGGPQVSAANSL